MFKDKDIAAVVINIDTYPVHFILHLMHSIEILGYKHPMEIPRAMFHNAYVRLVTALHLNPESEEEMDFRLRDGIPSRCHKT
jgi:hypothetical protein